MNDSQLVFAAIKLYLNSKQVGQPSADKCVVSSEHVELRDSDGHSLHKYPLYLFKQNDDIITKSLSINPYGCLLTISTIAGGFFIWFVINGGFGFNPFSEYKTSYLGGEQGFPFLLNPEDFTGFFNADQKWTAGKQIYLKNMDQCSSTGSAYICRAGYITFIDPKGKRVCELGSTPYRSGYAYFNKSTGSKGYELDDPDRMCRWVEK